MCINRAKLRATSPNLFLKFKKLEHLYFQSVRVRGYLSRSPSPEPGSTNTHENGEDSDEDSHENSDEEYHSMAKNAKNGGGSPSPKNGRKSSPMKN